MRSPLAANARRVNVARGASIRAPVGGWDAVSALADMPEDRAIVLDNWFPRPDSVELRKGSEPHSFPIATHPAIETLLVYNDPANISRMFAVATNGSGYDVTVKNVTTAPSSVFTGKQNARFQYANFTTIGGHFLIAVNGADVPLTYNGTAWANATITGPVVPATAIDPALFIHVNVFKNRLWFVIKDSTKVAYLATGAISGDMVTLELGTLLRRGGFIMAMGTWTRDAGDGQDDFAVFISSEGEVIVYQGTDPSSATTWELVGVFSLGAPLGRRCFEKVGGDLVLINIDGVLPLSRALITDRAAAQRIAITANIQNAMNAAARLYQNNFGWQLTVYPKGTRAILNVPVVENQQQQQYVMNTLTGAWCRFKGQNANCWALFNDDIYYGTNQGFVAKADTGNADIDQTIEAVGQIAYNYFGSRGILKNFGMLRPVISTDSNLSPAIGISTDFRDNVVFGQATAATFLTALWDNAVYDVDFYPVTDRVVSDWTALRGIGQCASIHFRVLSIGAGSIAFWNWDLNVWDGALWSNAVLGDLLLRLNSFDATYETGGFL